MLLDESVFSAFRNIDRPTILSSDRSGHLFQKRRAYFNLGQFQHSGKMHIFKSWRSKYAIMFAPGDAFLQPVVTV